MVDEVKTQSPAAAAPKFVEVPGKLRSKSIELDWPIEFDGKVYTHITLRRSTIGEWRKYFDAMEEEGKARYAMPCFSDPIEVLDNLDPDDDEKIQEQVDSFFPSRFKAKSPLVLESSHGEASPPSSSDT